jgi:hypothetical protein
MFMCLMVYIASDQSLPLIAWDETAPAFYVTELHTTEQSVRHQFTKPFIYYAGSHEGCGCGFDYGQWPILDSDDRNQEQAARETIRRLAIYLTSAVQSGTIEMFACWDGDQAAEPIERIAVIPAYFGGDAFAINEKQFLTVTLA